MAASSKSRVDPAFADNIAALAGSSAKIGAAVSGEGTRVWQAPRASSWGGDPADLGGMVAPFDRDRLNDDYASAISDPASPGTVGDLIALKAQIAHVGAMERAYRARMASPVRCLCHAAARRRGHGEPEGVLLGGSLGYIQDAVAAAQGDR